MTLRLMQIVALKNFSIPELVGSPSRSPSSVAGFRHPMYRLVLHPYSHVPVS